MELVRVTEVPSPCGPSADVDFAVHCAAHSSNDIATLPYMCEARPHCADSPLLSLSSFTVGIASAGRSIGGGQLVG